MASFEDATSQVADLDVIPRRVRVPAAVAIATMALLAAVAGYFGGNADDQYAAAEREQTVQTATAQRERSHFAQALTSYDRSVIVRAQAVAWVTAGRELLRTARGDDRATLQQTIDYWTVKDAQRNARDPRSSREILDREYRPGVLAEQRAEAYADLAHRWSENEDANLGVAGVLAVATMLVAVSIGLAAPSLRAAFVAVALLLALVSGGRLVVVNVSQPVVRDPRAVALYADAAVAAELGQTSEAIRALRNAIALDPRYGAAWEALGGTLLDDGTRESVVAAAAAYRRAIALDRTSAELLNNVGYAELLAGRLAVAQRYVDEALAEEPDDLTVQATAAELLVARGDGPAAMAAADALVAKVVRETRSFCDEFLAALRRDEVVLKSLGIGGSVRDDFYGRLRAAAAAFDAFGSPEPRPRGDAQLGDARMTPDPVTFRMTYRIELTGVRPSDVVSIRVFDEDLVLVRSALRDLAARPHLTGAVPLDPGKYTVEVYVNGVELGHGSAKFG